MSAGFLVVRTAGERYGVDLASIEEVVDLAAPPAPVPTRLAALRGVLRWRERHLSLLHLGALVAGGPAPAERGDTALVVRLAGVPVALEVDAVLEVVEQGGESVGASPTAGTAGVWAVEGELVTMLDLAALAGRLAEQGEAG